MGHRQATSQRVRFKGRKAPALPCSRMNRRTQSDLHINPPLVNEKPYIDENPEMGAAWILSKYLFHGCAPLPSSSTSDGWLGTKPRTSSRERGFSPKKTAQDEGVLHIARGMGGVVVEVLLNLVIFVFQIADKNLEEVSQNAPDQALLDAPIPHLGAWRPPDSGRGPVPVREHQVPT